MTDNNPLNEDLFKYQLRSVISCLLKLCAILLLFNNRYSPV